MRTSRQSVVTPREELTFRGAHGGGVLSAIAEGYLRDIGFWVLGSGYEVTSLGLLRVKGLEYRLEP